MQQSPRKSDGVVKSYVQTTAEQRAEMLLSELIRAREQLEQVKAWADGAGWRESGSDGLYAILERPKE